MLNNLVIFLTKKENALSPFLFLSHTPQNKKIDPFLSHTPQNKKIDPFLSHKQIKLEFIFLKLDLIFLKLHKRQLQREEMMVVMDARVE